MIAGTAAAAPVRPSSEGPFPKGLDVDATIRPGMNRSRRKPAGEGHGAPRKPVSREQPPGGLYGALDLGTNNCRLLIATPTQHGFSVVDAFSRIVRLGERLAQTGRLSEEAMGRTIDALRVCANKLRWRNVERVRLVATEACRMAENGPDFIARVRQETGLALEIIDRETEAGLAAVGAEPLVDRAGRNRPGLRHRRRLDRSPVDAPRRRALRDRRLDLARRRASSPSRSSSAAGST